MFHVEISSGLHRARVFNIGPDELREQVVWPWVSERRLELGDREWEPADSSLKILEGRRMENPDLAFGQGWANAERACDDVTGRVLAEVEPQPQPRAFAISAEAPEELAAAIAAERGGRELPWGEARDRLDLGRGGPAAVIFVYGADGGE